MPDAAKFFDSRSDGNGGVTLKLRHKFRDMLATELDEDGVARTRRVKDAENGNSDTVRNTIFTFTPADHESYEFVEGDRGMVSVVLSTPAADYPGNGTVPNAGTTDKRSRYLASTLGGDAKKLASMNSANKRYYQR